MKGEHVGHVMKWHMELHGFKNNIDQLWLQITRHWNHFKVRHPENMDTGLQISCNFEQDMSQIATSGEKITTECSHGKEQKTQVEADTEDRMDNTKKLDLCLASPSEASIILLKHGKQFYWSSDREGG